jgi:hypothetical protein
MASGAPLKVNSTSPQKQLALCSFGLDIMFSSSLFMEKRYGINQR